MHLEVTSTGPPAVDADLVAVVAGTPGAEALDARLGGALGRAAADGDPVAMVHVSGGIVAPRAAFVPPDEPTPEGLRSAAARAVRALRGGGSVAFALDASLPVALADQV